MISLRSTNNSLAAGFDATSLSGKSEHFPLSTSANAEVLCPSCSDAHSPLPQASRQADVPSPAFLALVVAAVKQALAADQTLPGAEASSSVAGGIPATFSSSLQSQASALAVSGVGFPPVQASMAGAALQMQGRPNFVVPSFVSTFRCWRLLLLLRTRVSRPGFSPPCFHLHQVYLLYSSRSWLHRAFRPSYPN